VQTVIAPAVARGDVVLCDRFTDATFAYQGGGRGFDPQVLNTLENWVHPDVQPDLTLWFDLPAEVASQRRAAARQPDRFEQLDTAFFDRVRSAYAERAAQAPQRIARINAALSFEAVAQQVFKVLQAAGW
jgi:dTMP kinase